MQISDRALFDQFHDRRAKVIYIPIVAITGAAQLHEWLGIDTVLRTTETIDASALKRNLFR
jgi:FMN-dependent NADH-azoreductase